MLLSALWKMCWVWVSSIVTAKCGSFIENVSSSCHWCTMSNQCVLYVIVTKPFFAKERVTDFNVFDSKAKLAIQKMQEHFDQGLAIDFQVSVILLTSTLALICIFRISAVGSPSTQRVSFSWVPRFTVSKIPFRGLEKLTAICLPRATVSPAPLPTHRP
jgi:hypothetical protein